MVYHENMFAKFLALIGVVSAVFLFVVLQITITINNTPSRFTGCIYFDLYSVGVATVFGLYYGVEYMLESIVRVFGGPLVEVRSTMQRAYIYATILAFGPVILIGMRSVGSFGLVDIFLVALFELIACFYIWRRQ